MINDKTNDNFERFSVVLYQLSEQQHANFEKTIGVGFVGKIIGLPKEFIEITSNEILINDKVVAQLTAQAHGHTLSRQQIPLDHYFIILDGNLHDLNQAIHTTGMDSRQLGFIHKNSIARTVKKYDFLKLPRTAMFEIISGGLILFLFTFAHWYIKHISAKYLPLSIIVFVFYAFISIMIIVGGMQRGMSIILIAVHYSFTHSVPHPIQKELIPTLSQAIEKRDALIKVKNDCAFGELKQINDCLASKYIDVDKKLNEKYRDLINSLKDGAALKNAEIAWIKFRDSSCDYAKSSLGLSNENYLYVIANNKCLIDLTEKRILELEQYSQWHCKNCTHPLN